MIENFITTSKSQFLKSCDWKMKNQLFKYQFCGKQIDFLWFEIFYPQTGAPSLRGKIDIG